MVTIDKNKIVFCATFLAKNDQEALIDVPLEGAALNLSVSFRASAAGSERTGSWTTEGGRTKFVFEGWNNPLGTCTREPTKFAEIGTRKIYFQLINHAIEDINSAQFFILMGD